MTLSPEQQPDRPEPAQSPEQRQAIRFLIVKVAIFMIVPLLASAIAVYVML